jgi:hypothetical protein
VQWKSGRAVTLEPVGSSHTSHIPYLRRRAGAATER